MTSRKVGVVLVVLGLALVGLGVYLKRAHGMGRAMIVLHTLATLGGLIPGVMLIVRKPRHPNT